MKSIKEFGTTGLRSVLGATVRAGAGKGRGV